MFDHLGDQDKKIPKLSNFAGMISGEGRVILNPLTRRKESLSAYTTPTNIENIAI